MRTLASLVEGSLGRAVSFIRAHAPEQAGRYIMPYLVFALTVLVILQLVVLKQARDQSHRSAEQAKAAAKSSAQTLHALCALRDDLHQRIVGAEDFLRKHPGGIPGIPAKTIQATVDGQRRTIAALGGLRCVPPERREGVGANS
jgi:hypothetical protein